MDKGDVRRTFDATSTESNKTFHELRDKPQSGWKTWEGFILKRAI